MLEVHNACNTFACTVKPRMSKLALICAGAAAVVLVGRVDRFKLHAKASSSKWDSNWDHLATDNGAEPLTKDKEHKLGASRHIILVRHGHYARKKKDEKVLTAVGRWQAAVTGRRLKELKHPYSTIYHSTMPRAAETAHVIHDSLPEVAVQSCDLLREGAPAVPEPPSSSWKPHPHEFFRDSARIEAAFRKYFHRATSGQENDSYDIFVCHANVIRYFVCRALQLPPEAWLRFSLGHGSITAITIHPTGDVTVTTLGNTGHLPPELLTFH